VIRYLLVLLLAFQEKPPEEKIIARIPEFYFVRTDVAGFNGGSAVELTLPRQANHKYFFLRLDDAGLPMGREEEVSEANFYGVVRGILRYGVRDITGPPGSQLNPNYRDLVRHLLEKKIVSEADLRKVAGAYANANWLESLFWLDEAFPGVFKAHVYNFDPAESHINMNECFVALTGIKLDKGDRKMLNEAAERVNKRLELHGTYSGYRFETTARAYAELCKRGAALSERARQNLLQSYFAYDKNYRINLRLTYAFWGLPLPEKKSIYEALLQRMKQLAEPDPKLVGDFRVFGLDFPKDFATLYRDALLGGFGVTAFEDLEYLFKFSGEEGVSVETWKKYGDEAFSWHLMKEARKTQKDTGDYYHAAVECYRRVAPFVIQLEELQKELDGKRNKNEAELNTQKTLAKLLPRLKFGPVKKEALMKEFEDTTVRLGDVLIAYELCGLDPREEYLLEKFEKRAEASRKGPAGAYFGEQGKILWHATEYGQLLVPFRDDIGLAAGLKDGQRIRKLSQVITDWAMSEIASEGVHLSRYYPQLLASSATPAYLSLDAVIGFYEEMQFTEGARSLAQHLWDVGLEIPAFRLFKIAGLEKEATEKFYGRFSEAELMKRQSELNLRLRTGK